MAVATDFVGHLSAVVLVLASFCQGQKEDTKAADQKSSETTVEKLRDLPAEWLIGPYIPSGLPLQPLTNQQRTEVYLNQTFLSAPAYVARIFVAGIDQARGTPSEWGGGMPGFGLRFGSRYGSFVIASTVQSLGNAALGYESRYDLCRCKGLERRSLHAIARNFVTYNRTERELRPAIPLYAGSFGAGMISSTWLPGRRNMWMDGAYSALVQAGYGSAVNWVSEFSLDILRKITKRRYPGEIRGNPPSHWSASPQPIDRHSHFEPGNPELQAGPDQPSVLQRESIATPSHRVTGETGNPHRRRNEVP